MRATLWCQILAVELDEIVRILKLFFSLLYLIFEINIYKWADFIQIVCTGQNLVAMLKYKYFFFFFLQDILYYEQLKTNVLQHDLLVDSLLYKVRNFCKFTIFGVTYILSWKVVFLLILYVNLKCDIEYFFFILIRGRFSLELLSLHIVINASAILACVRNID